MPQYELLSDHMKEETKNFMTSLGSLIGNYREGIFQPTSLSLIYNDSFGESSDTDDNALTYSDKLVNAKSETVDKASLEVLDNYIGTEIVLAGKDAIPILDKVNKQKRDANNLPIGDANSNSILDTCIYELESPDGRIEG